MDPEAYRASNGLSLLPEDFCQRTRAGRVREQCCFSCFSGACCAPDTPKLIISPHDKGRACCRRGRAKRPSGTRRGQSCGKKWKTLGKLASAREGTYGKRQSEFLLGEFTGITSIDVAASGRLIPRNGDDGVFIPGYSQWGRASLFVVHLTPCSNDYLCDPFYSTGSRARTREPANQIQKRPTAIVREPPRISTSRENVGKPGCKRMT
ncbi:syndecan isoform X4 [Lasioglossum baleicum]|uniref:syndecan isoform X4 n=1 Tax=Lasioglossum baleicum TaxID=434251 RepID=UPI003FCE0115